MSSKGSSCVVLNQKEEVLLVLREDFRIWALPGGGLEPNETWEQAAVRETLEETGYEVEILQYVGEYWRPQMSEGQGDLKRVFLAKVIGGSPSQHDDESIDVRWFPISALPRGLFQLSREHIYDALARSPTPLRREQHLPIWLAALLRMAFLVRRFRNRIFSSKKQERKNNEQSN
jgi:ADP-ribose pyrophosphatase YjhB (NUDIX family)